MEDYPRTMIEFETRFGTEEACRAYLVELRWPDGFRCPSCGGAVAWPVRSVLWQCAECGRQTSVTAGTAFQDTRTPLTTWFRAMWCVSSSKTGTSALALQQILGLGSYRTAWAWLHKLRRAMVRPGRDRLCGEVEVDESFIGGIGGAEGRSTATKALIIVAAEALGRGIGRVRMRRIPDGSAASLGAFVQDAIEPGSVVLTDGWHGYDRLKANGYRHQAILMRGDAELAIAQLPRVHRVISLLKRWLLGTHQGAVTQVHLDYYLDEFTFRFNRRRSRHRGKLFFRLVQQAVVADPITYRQIVKHTRRGRRRHHKG